MGSKGMDSGWTASVGVLETHNRHARVTFADPELAGPRSKLNRDTEAREADWMMRNRNRWHLMDREKE